MLIICSHVVVAIQIFMRIFMWANTVWMTYGCKNIINKYLYVYCTYSMIYVVVCYWFFDKRNWILWHDKALFRIYGLDKNTCNYVLTHVLPTKKIFIVAIKNTNAADMKCVLPNLHDLKVPPTESSTHRKFQPPKFPPAEISTHRKFHPPKVHPPWKI